MGPVTTTGGSDPPLVGREPALERIDAILDGLGRRGGGACLAITGEPGAGTTRLCSELVCRATARGIRVIAGRGAELEHGVPFAMLIDALEPVVSELAGGRDSGLRPGTLAELARVFPTLLAEDTVDEPGDESERWRFHHAITEVLEQLTGDRPLVLVLDDLHWADPASARLIADLLRRPPAVPLLVALGYRRRSAARALISAAAAAERERTLTVLEASPLSEAQSSELLGDGLPLDARRDLHRESGGIPFYLLELARDLGSAGADDAIPTGILDAVAEQVRALSDPATRLSRAAAVLGEPFALDLATEVAELAEGEAIEAMDELLAREFAREADEPGRFRFQHPIVGTAVYESSADGWRIGAHTRAAIALERRDAPAVVRARHLERSARVGDAGAIAVLTAAAAEVAPTTPLRAARWYDAALRLMPAQAESEALLRVLVALAASLIAAGVTERGREVLDRALELTGPESLVGRAKALRAIAGLEHMRGKREEADLLLTSARASLADHSSVEAARVEIEVAVGHWIAGQWDAQRERAGRAVAVAAELDDLHVQSEAVALLALSEYCCGRTRAAAERIAEADGLLGALPDGELVEALRAVLFLGHAEFGMERFEQAVQRLDRGARLARESGQGLWLSALAAALAFPYGWLGRLDEAADQAETARRAALRIDNHQALVWSATSGAWVAGLRGDLASAVRLADEAAAAVARVPAAVFAPFARCQRGAALAMAGSPDEAVRVIVDAGGGSELNAIDAGFRSYWLGVLAEAELAAGRPDAAEAWVARAEASADSLGLAGRKGMALRARAGLLLVRGESEEAAAVAERAAADLHEAGQRVDAARAIALAGRALGAAGRKREAVERLGEAHGELIDCGARRDADNAAQALRALGSRPARRLRLPSGADELEGLTGREREVAGLVALGLTNRQIADELFVSVKTVESHISAAFRKLGVGARAELAAEVERARTRAAR